MGTSDTREEFSREGEAFGGGADDGSGGAGVIVALVSIGGAVWGGADVRGEGAEDACACAAAACIRTKRDKEAHWDCMLLCYKYCTKSVQDSMTLQQNIKQNNTGINMFIVSLFSNIFVHMEKNGPKRLIVHFYVYISILLLIA